MKKIFSFAAIAAVVLTTGCADNEIIEVNPDSPDNIVFAPTSARGTRAEAAGYETLQDGVGFKVYALTASNTGNWYYDGAQFINGTNDHKWDKVGKKWNFDKPVKWPTATADYPMNFYAYYAANYTGLTMEANPTLGSLTGTYVVHGTAATQVDFLAATATASNKPVSAALSITFKHILSKVNYAAKVPTGFDAYVHTVGVENVANQRTFNFKTGAWTSALTKGDCVSDYVYYGATAIKSTVIQMQGNGNGSPFYLPGDNASFMLMPQNVTGQSWVYVEASKNKPDKETFVWSLYRVAKVAGEADANYVGFEHASAHPNYAESSLSPSYNGPLYIKAGYSYTLNWEPGKGYTYNLAMPGGVYLSDTYYKEDGTETDLKVIGGEPGGPIISKDEFIHLIPVVEDWNESAGPTDLQ